MMATNKKLVTRNNNVDLLQKHVQVTKPGPFSRTKWALMRGVLSTIGRTSKGIQIGYRYGFDSGIMLDYVYVNEAHGLAGIGKVIDRAYLNAIGWRAIRARRALLKQLLRDEIERNRAASTQTRLLDVAAGPGRDDVRILCRDLSVDGLIEGAKQAKAAGLQRIHYEQGNAFNPAPVATQLGGTPNIIVVCGLYELILDDETIQQSLVRLYQMLAPGGAIFITTQTHHPQLDFIANVLPNRNGILWVMKCRQAGQLEAWARSAGFNGIQSQAEEVGLFMITTGRKLT